MIGRTFQTRARAFTLVELLVSMSLLVVLVLSLSQITNSTQKIWTSTTGKVEQFRDAREAFDTITQRLSQATLNTYWDYQTTSPGVPVSYGRQSELRFLSGPGYATVQATDPPRPTHAVFFQAPLGNSTSYQSLENSLNTTGYFIEFASDETARPAFYNQTGVPGRYRFRLMEMIEPSERLSLYSPAGNLSWFQKPLALPGQRRVVAENIVALILLPRLAKEDKDSNGKPYNVYDLAPAYTYDSTTAGAGGATDAALNTHNQLPPIVQVSIVAVDETSFARLQSPGSSTMPSDLFPSGSFTDAKLYEQDLQALQDRLLARKLSYRIFSSNVSLKAAKWSRFQQN